MKHKRMKRNGLTLLDVATASMIFSVMLIPSLHLMSRSQKNSRLLQLHESMLFELDKLIEQTKVQLSEPATFDQAWRSSFPTENVAKLQLGDGPAVIGTVRISRNTTVTTNGLLMIDATVWHDENRNGRFDSGEPHESARTEWAAP
ncbi:hypothetical protein CA13_49990 [Planctomycetes bacterium CA13]|uniref:Uncharacterized protein n=1 Tax=Novipirellula herctigrandis TaxID=2527986 RepID=A0A5C5Z899_9BACT|nr:hypothetical protein CA13_49990 [Planctomycetes bacterium CA13]